MELRDLPQQSKPLRVAADDPVGGHENDLRFLAQCLGRFTVDVSPGEIVLACAL